MYFVCRAHQHKAKPYIMALKRAGYKLTYNVARSDFILVDYPNRKQAQRAIKFNKPIFYYPHSVRPNAPWDVMTEPLDAPTAFFTIAEGHKEIMRRIGYDFPIEVAGWSYTAIHPFMPVKHEKKIRVLFAPIHPIGTGFLPDIDRELNAKTYKLLLGMLDNITLTVRHLQPLVHNALWENSQVKFIAAGPTGDTSDMNLADIVIGAFTYAHMAVALGKPLIMMGEEVIPHNSPMRGAKLVLAKNWDKYRDYLRFPYNIEDVFDKPDDALKMMQAALRNEPKDWKKLFIGKPFVPGEFVKTLEGYL